MKAITAPLLLIAVSIIGAAIVTPIHAAYGDFASARTDKPSYLPGDSGTLYVTVKNTGTLPFTVKNVTVIFPWMAFITDHWDGNFTDNGPNNAGINDALAIGQTFNKQYSFTVPTDGRASNLFGFTRGIQVSIGTDIGQGAGPQIQTPSTTATISIASATYDPIGSTSTILSVAFVVILAVAVAMLTMVYIGIRKLSKK